MASVPFGFVLARVRVLKITWFLKIQKVSYAAPISILSKTGDLNSPKPRCRKEKQFYATSGAGVLECAIIIRSTSSKRAMVYVIAN
jgi:hypothetical protein